MENVTFYTRDFIANLRKAEARILKKLNRDSEGLKTDPFRALCWSQEWFANAADVEVIRTLIGVFERAEEVLTSKAVTDFVAKHLVEKATSIGNSTSVAHNLCEKSYVERLARVANWGAVTDAIIEAHFIWKDENSDYVIRIRFGKKDDEMTVYFAGSPSAMTDQLDKALRFNSVRKNEIIDIARYLDAGGFRTPSRQNLSFAWKQVERRADSAGTEFEA